MKRDDVLATLRSHEEKLRNQFFVRSLALFGSVARNEAGPASDIDLLVEFLADAKTVKAVAADLTIVGEAARHVPDAVVQAHPEIPWALMRGMRNRIVHGYYQVDPVIVWDTCQNDLPALIDPLKKLLALTP